MKYLIALCCCLFTGLAVADYVEQEGSFIYLSSEDFSLTKENIEMAIEDQGLRVSGTLHVSEMLNRTAKDLGITNNIFIKAESLEFCSALWSHKMIQLDPLNINVCPFTIAIYTKTDEPEKVYVAFRKPLITGDDKNNSLQAEIMQALQEIIEDSI